MHFLSSPLPFVVVLALLAVSSLAGCGRGDDTSAGGNTATATPAVTTMARIFFIDAEGNLATMDPDGSDVRPITQGGGVQAFAPSPDGSLAALQVAAPGGNVLRIVRAEGSTAFEQTGAKEPLWSPRGGRLALLVGDSIQVVDTTGNVILNIPHAVRPAWSPDETSLAVVRLNGAQGVPVITEVGTGSEVPLAANIEPHDPVYQLAWHPSGTSIGYRNRLYELATGTEVELPGTAVSWSPDGRTLMVTLPDNPAERLTVVQLLDATDGLKPVIGLDVPPAADGTPGWAFVEHWTDWSPDGRYLVYLDPTPGRERVRLYDTLDVAQDIFRFIKGERPEISPDSTAITFMDSGKVWVLPFDGSVLNFIAEGGFPAWTPAGG